jgi:hypothetical protein
MMAYQYANIEKYLHGISFNGGSHMPWRQGLLARFCNLAQLLEASGRNRVSSQFVDAMFLEDVRRDERQLLNWLAEFRGHASRSNKYEANLGDGGRNLQMRWSDR